VIRVQGETNAARPAMAPSSCLWWAPEDNQQETKVRITSITSAESKARTTGGVGNRAIGGPKDCLPVSSKSRGAHCDQL